MRNTLFSTCIGAAAILTVAACGAAAGKNGGGGDVLPSLSDAGAWQLVNNAGPQVQIARQGTIDISTFTGTVTQGDGRATDVTIQPVSPVHLVEGQHYKFVYDIAADQIRDVRVIVQTVGNKEMNYYILTKKRPVGMGFSHYEDNFTATHLDKRPVLVEFGVGAYEGAVYLQNVSLTPDGPPPAAPPSNG